MNIQIIPVKYLSRGTMSGLPDKMKRNKELANGHFFKALAELSQGSANYTRRI